MCELFGFSSQQPLAAHDLPLHTFRLHGGLTASNPDGWGMAWQTGSGLQLEKAPVPGHSSERFAELIDTVQSNLIVAHVRRARLPPINTQNNTHPFLHHCCDRPWVFAHNGLVPDMQATETAECNALCHPAGQTDSEFAFCHLLRHLSGHIHTCGSDEEWLGILSQVSAQIAAHGKFNFLLSDGRLLIAYGHDRLHHCALSDAHPANPAILIATEPLDDAVSWSAFQPGELRIYQDGLLCQQRLTNAVAPTPS